MREFCAIFYQNSAESIIWKTDPFCRRTFKVKYDSIITPAYTTLNSNPLWNENDAALSQRIRTVMHFDTCDDLMEIEEQAADCRDVL